MKFSANRAMLLGCVAGACMMHAVAAHAQAEPAQAEPQGEAARAGGSSGIADIVVTAQKRAQNLNDVGITIAALGAEDLASKKITTLTDVASAVPGLSLSSGPTNAPVLTLRGVGFYDRTLAAAPAVSIYQDEIPLTYAALAAQTAFDLERIEVLKGPQGTLFGQNSTGGALNYVAAKPTSDFRAGGDLSYGRFNAVEANAFVSGSIAEGVNARLAVHSAHADAWQYDYVRNGRDDNRNGEVNVFAARLLVDIEASDALRFSINVNGWKDKSDPLAPRFIAANPQIPSAASEGLLTQPFAPSDPRAAAWSPEYQPRANNRLGQASLRADLDVTDDITLTSLTAYTDYKQRMTPGGDGLVDIVQDIAHADGFIKTFTQELRLSNGGGSDLHWVVGGNYSRDKTLEDDLLRFNDVSTAEAFGITTTGTNARINTRALAAFANAEYELGSNLTFKAGGRYTSTKRTASLCAYDGGDGLANILFTNVSRGVTGDPNRPLLQPGQCYTILPDGTNGPRYDVSLNEDNFSWRAGVDWKPSNGMLFYANVSKGYKAGGFPVIPAASYNTFVPVKQESVLAYEAGFKLSMFDRAVQFNGAAYYYDYRDKQLLTKINDPVFLTIDALGNIPKSRVWGLEGGLTVAPVEGLIATLDVNYTSTKIQRGTGVNGAGQPADFAGTEFPFIPKWQVGFSADYKFPQTGSIVPFVGASVTYRDQSYAILGATLPFDQVIRGSATPFVLPSYTLVDLRGGIEFEDGKYKLSIYGKNIFNKYYAQNAFLQFDDTVQLPGRPATWGVTFGFKFQ